MERITEAGTSTNERSPAGPVGVPAPPPHPAPSRTERLIAGARVTLVVAALVTLSLDSTQPARYEDAETYVLLGAYVVYALALAIHAWRTYRPSRASLIVTQGLDLLAPTVLVALFEGPPVSPFFVFFVFSLFSATLRWSWRGTVWTAACALVLFGAVGLVVRQFVVDELVYLSVVAGLLAYMGAWEQRRRGEVAKLAAWPTSVPADLRATVREALQHAAGILGVPRVVLAWAEAEEPGRYVAYLNQQAFELARDAERDLRAFVSPALVDSAFFCADARNTGARVLTGNGDERRSLADPIDRRLRSRFEIGSVLTLPLAGAEWEGRLFFLDKPRMTADDLVLARIVRQQIAARLDHHHVLRRLQQSAVVEERMGFARDLHDGLLQALTAIALQVQTALRLVPQSPERAAERLLEVQAQVLVSQKTLRSYIRELKPITVVGDQPAVDLTTRLQGLADQLGRQWGLTVNLDVPAAPRAAERHGLARHVLYLVHEAVVNAARHGNASVISVVLREDSEQVVILATDNGGGFSFTGRFDLAALDEMNTGPATLKERIAALRGSLTVESSRAGARVEIGLPLPAARI
jgi:signal transduction histidine kinase